jgi:hypothetical protein
MDWSVPFIVYRVSEGGEIAEVFHAEDLKKAKYWLTYIAQPGDVLCRTPAHPRHDGERPSYWSHKQSSGTPASKEAEWRKHAEERNYTEEFPESQQLESIASS